jgi:hypothetical protein
MSRVPERRFFTKYRFMIPRAGAHFNSFKENPSKKPPERDFPRFFGGVPALMALKA